jgi:hypothetical protein
VKLKASASANRIASPCASRPRMSSAGTFCPFSQQYRIPKIILQGLPLLGQNVLKLVCCLRKSKVFDEDCSSSPAQTDIDVSVPQGGALILYRLSMEILKHGPGPCAE